MVSYSHAPRSAGDGVKRRVVGGGLNTNQTAVISTSTIFLCQRLCLYAGSRENYTTVIVTVILLS